ncbi:bifunctional diguanylate cyclase/phosphodiesterase [Sphingomonas sp.]|uniref:putative bifunctional diguanylate cyclase/phosphodiesterase n=1 Tax=Sphingomonas sp. TaxID=28214 RepID=UPI0025CD3D62|nr:bifunctional diguanylate cyclase/phosphodiesterase [Sphingomonas sp.]
MTRSRSPAMGAMAGLAPSRSAIDETSDLVRMRQTYLEALPIAAAVVTLRTGSLKIHAANAAWKRLDSQRVAGRDHVLDGVGCADEIIAVLNGDSEAQQFEWRDGGMIDGRHFTVSVAALCAGDRADARVLVTLIDRTNEVQTEKSLRLEMLTDSLTGLMNRAGFVDHLETRMIDDGSENYAVMIVDLARFSRVNECVGSLGGDELIITVARRLMSTLRGYDLLARTGANEFAMVVRLVDGPGDVLHVARRVGEVLSRPCKLSDFEIKVDCAVGCALATESGVDAEKLMRHAQIALKEAKRTQRVELYQPAALAASHRCFTLETELRRAIESESLDMAFQPLMALGTGRIAGFEALARWNHPDLGVVPPSEFIAVAEESGLIIPLGRWALDRALSTLKSWDKAAGRDLPLYVGVNLSAIQVQRDDIAGLVGAALRDHRLSGYRLSVELTESAIVADPERAGRTLDALKSVDAMVAMDDFGTGFSNLASLQKLPIDTLKIDRSFITGMLGDPDKIAIVRAILSLAQALGMTTTAEGIETRELSQTLAALGCTTGQGYFYSPALEPDAALRFALDSLG